MKVLSSIEQTRAAVAAMRGDGRSIGFVPTMGALHVAHRSLIDAACDRCDAVVVSIFVNPTQFCPGEDYEQYPRPLEADLAMCRQAGVMYPIGSTTTVRVDRLTDGLCGAHRPGHFDGVTTVVAKLFNIVAPDVAFFGEKDYQQLKVIARMVRDLDMPIEIVGCPTVRDKDGLAMSSRNAYLSPWQREQAVSLSQAMGHAAEAVAAGTRDASALIEQMERQIREAGAVDIDYVSVVDAETLESLDEVRGASRFCVAVRIGGCRLIDNLAVDVSGAMV